MLQRVRRNCLGYKIAAAQRVCGSCCEISFALCHTSCSALSAFASGGEISRFKMRFFFQLRAVQTSASFLRSFYSTLQLPFTIHFLALFLSRSAFSFSSASRLRCASSLRSASALRSAAATLLALKALVSSASAAASNDCDGESRILLKIGIISGNGS